MNGSPFGNYGLPFELAVSEPLSVFDGVDSRDVEQRGLVGVFGSLAESPSVEKEERREDMEVRYEMEKHQHNEKG